MSKTCDFFFCFAGFSQLKSSFGSATSPCLPGKLTTTKQNNVKTEKYSKYSRRKKKENQNNRKIRICPNCVSPATGGDETRKKWPKPKFEIRKSASFVQRIAGEIIMKSNIRKTNERTTDENGYMAKQRRTKKKRKNRKRSCVACQFSIYIEVRRRRRRRASRLLYISLIYWPHSLII